MKSGLTGAWALTTLVEAKINKTIVVHAGGQGKLHGCGLQARLVYWSQIS
jgi:hypothetical protein